MFQQNLQLCTMSLTPIMTNNMHLYVNIDVYVFYDLCSELKRKHFCFLDGFEDFFPFLYLDNKTKESQMFCLILISGIASDTFLLLYFAFLDSLADPV